MVNQVNIPPPPRQQYGGNVRTIRFTRRNGKSVNFTAKSKRRRRRARRTRMRKNNQMGGIFPLFALGGMALAKALS